jgi:hypothetical protein
MRLVSINNGVNVALSANSVGNNAFVGTLSIPCDSMTELVRTEMVANSSLASDKYGLFAMKGGVNTDKFKIASLTPPKHLWSGKKEGCQFDPKGNFGSRRAEFDLNEIVFHGQQCPDTFYDNGWYQLFGTGRPMDMLRSANGLTMVRNLVTMVSNALTNDLWNLVTFGSHPLITTADGNGAYVNYTSAQDWTDFKDQQDKVGGFVTAAEYLRTTGLYPNYSSVSIAGGDISGSNYTGDVLEDLFVRVKAAATAEKELYVNRSRSKEVWLVTKGIFEKGKTELREKFPALQVGYDMFVNGVGMNGGMSEYYEWDGKYIVKFDEPQIIDSITGYNTHMVLATVPQNIAILTGGDPNRFGLQVQNTGLIKDQGKLFMDAYLRIGTGFINPELVTFVSTSAVKA